MQLLFCLNDMLTHFRPLFNKQSYALFVAVVKGLILSDKATLTRFYQTSIPQSRYWSLVKFFSRSKWSASAVAIKLLTLIQSQFDNWVYIYDETKAIKTGKKQYGLHFFRNYRYNKRNTNQSKFHWGHQFGALGLLCQTVSQTIFFGIWVKMIVPKSKRWNRLAVFESIVRRIRPGLIVFDRGFNNRKIFKALLDCGHELLCRAKSNAVFYQLPTEADQPKRGRRKLYGKRVSRSRLRFAKLEFDGEEVSVASIVGRTKMCQKLVRLVVVRRKPKKSKPYRYFCVYTTDMKLSVLKILQLYKARWGIETAFRDAKGEFGFSEYQLKSRKSINRFVQLSFLAMALTQLVVYKVNQSPGLLEKVVTALKIHWYVPVKLTQGLIVAYLKQVLRGSSFSAFSSSETNSAEMEAAD